MSRALTPRTQLDTLRKEAKCWLKALRLGDPKAASRLAAAWPGAPAEPVLRDLQHALALEYGQTGWIQLKAALDDLALARKSQAEQAERLLAHGWDGDPAAAARLLRRHPELSRFSLFTAAACGDLAEVERRLASDPLAATRTGGPHGWTALAHVAYGRLDGVNALEVARRLLAAGADPNFEFNDGWDSPFKIVTGAIGLGEGAKSSHPQALQLVDLLIQAGANAYDSQALYDISIVGSDTYWYDVLWTRSQAQGVLDQWRVPAQNRLGGARGVSSLDYLLGNAVGQNHLERAEWLLERGAHADAPHFYTRQPVHALAQLSGFHEMAALLERHGARKAVLSGAKALQAACMRGDEQGARALATADPALAKDPSPLLSAAELGNARAVAILLALGAPATASGQDGVTPLHRAVQSGSLEAVQRLVAAGADVDLREKRWRGTALSWAVTLNQPDVAAWLAPLSHDVRALTHMGDAARLQAVLDERPELANQALAFHDGPTPLFCLPDDERVALKMAPILLIHGADPSVRNAKGLTPVDRARDLDHEDVATLMETWHAR